MMAVGRLIDLTAETTPATTDITYLLIDPATTPAPRKITVADLVAGAPPQDHGSSHLYDGSDPLTVAYTDKSLVAYNLPGPGGSSPAQNSTELTVDYSGNATNTQYITREIEHDFKEGENLELHMHWMPEDTTAGNTYWQIDWRWHDMGSPPGSWTTAYKTIAAPGAVNHTYATMLTMTGTGMAISSIAQFKISRLGADPSDTYNGKLARVFCFGLHYAVDYWGSKNLTSK
jgi:hypothetical protein